MRLGESSYIAGIAFVVSTHSGPQFVYHCEAKKPIEYLTSAENDLMSDSDTEDSIDLTDTDDEDPSARTTSNAPTMARRRRHSRAVNVSSPRHKARRAIFGGADTHDEYDPEKAVVFGYEPSFLAEMLSPPGELCNQRFELGVDDYIFLGMPVHIIPGGTWRKLKTQETSKKDEILDSRNEGLNDTTEENLSSEEHPNTNFYNDKKSPLRMFNVVFVLNPPINESVYVADQLYRYVVTLFARLLRNEQASRNYVWEEARKIMAVRDKYLSNPKEWTTPLREEIESESELARSLDQLCQAISQLNIARVQIAGKMRAFQVPIDLEITRMSSVYETNQNRFYPTTSKIAGKEIDENCFDSYGLLLLDDAAKILQHMELASSAPVVELIRNLSPTMSIRDLANAHDIEIKQMVNLVYSLVYWRCARIIIPLHHRNFYGVSPFAPLDRVQQLSEEFLARFPMMSSLSRLLSSLSTGKLQPYVYHIPSRDHHEVYMHALAWLLRHNFVVQLQTYAMVVATRKIKLMVYHELEDNNEAAPQAGPSRTEPEEKTFPDASTDNTSKGVDRQKTDARPWDSLDALDDIQESFIADPRGATLIEKKWIDKITADRPPEQVELFHRLLKYFNSKDPLEQAILHEKISRHELRRFLQDFSENIVLYRHW